MQVNYNQPPMATVILTAAAQREFLDLPSVIQSRVTNIIERLGG